MMIYRTGLMVLTVMIGAMTLSLGAHADIFVNKKAQQTQPRPQATQPTASPEAISYAKAVANACLGGKWEDQPCLKAVSENNLSMASNYAATLQESGNEKSAELIKQRCAASTAATQDEYPAYAMRSAFVECVNIIVDVVGASKIKPDLSQYQLLVSAVQCLDKTTACTQVETGLARYK